MINYVRNGLGLFRASAHELKNLHALVLTAQFTAMQVVASMVVLSPVPWVEVRFDFVFHAATAMLFGPVPAMMQGIVADFLRALLRGKGFFLGYTLSAMLSGLVYGFALYRVRVGWLRALCTKGVINLFINLGLGTLWQAILQNKGFLLLLPGRTFKNLVMLLVEPALLVSTYAILQRIQQRKIR